jgi:hypothetical protein
MPIVFRPSRRECLRDITDRRFIGFILGIKAAFGKQKWNDDETGCASTFKLRFMGRPLWWLANSNHRTSLLMTKTRPLSA